MTAAEMTTIAQWQMSTTTLCLLLVFTVLVLLTLVSVHHTVRNFRKAREIQIRAGRVGAQGNNWHVLDIARVQAELETGPAGLTSAEAARRLARFDPNRLPEVRIQGPVQRFFLQFHNILIYVLLATCVITAMLEHWLDSGVIFGVVIINAIIGFVQEGKARDALAAIRQMLSPQATLLRDGRKDTVPAEDVVPGDIVLLQSGDRVPADLRLLESRELQIQEAVLTGASVPVRKSIVPVAETAVLGDRCNMAYSGTLVTSGRGTGIVVATGRDTEIGYITALVASVEELTTPLLRQIAHFARWLTVAILLIAAGTFAFGVLVRGFFATEMFLAAVGLAVAAIPEGLPAIMTITLAIGVTRMARRKAIIRRLPAVETLGAVSVICTDKTGTLTRNEMTVRSIATAEQLFQVSGAGYRTEGAFSSTAGQIRPADYPVLLDMIQAAALCNDAELERQGDGFQVHGDPMEGALLVAALKAELDLDNCKKCFPRRDLIPFESEHRFMATLHHDEAGGAVIYVKGAPERLLQMCQWQRTSAGDQPLPVSFWQGRIEELASQGQRLLAVAVKPASAELRQLAFADVGAGLALLGMFGLMDPPRQDAIAAVRQCQAAGIRVKMITGDHGITALSIARQLHLVNTGQVLLGADLQNMHESELSKRVLDIDVYARVSPAQKLLLVQLLQQHGSIVAMTGDGVNDAPALKRADVGIAMGIKGTEAAKEAAEMVLADDNFASIVHAVEEGRTVYDNIRKAILFILPSSGGEALIIIVAILFGYHQLPLTPVQILWVNMVTTVTLALVLAFEPGEQDIMQRPPRPSREPVLSLLLVWRIVFVSIILMTGTFGLFLWEMRQGMSIEHARTVAVNTLVMFEVFYLFNSRYISASVLNFQGLFGNRYILLAIALLLLFQLAFTYLGFMQVLFRTTAINAAIWGRILLVSASVLFLVELEKALIRRCRRA